ncbi:MAG: type II toxin-antitoxin system VapC family toxin [Gammaproteobacteria bacterium]|nr:type II toxin-antitoxin system VapC family toxin [Gammaproteobacteria bacterium]
MILDASALLALIQNEPGAERVQLELHHCSISAVNWSEVVQKLIRYDPDAANMRPALEEVGLKITPFSSEQAELCASLWLPCKNLGLSLADRICLQLGMSTGKTILTADTAWDKLDILEISIEQIR